MKEPVEQLTIRRATVDDAETLARFAGRVFRESYQEGADPHELELHISSKFGLVQQRGELLDRDMTTLLLYQDAEVAGYAQVRRAASPECVSSAAAFNLFRFYVDQRWHGSGVAATLMRAVLSEAGSFAADSVWLGVWAENHRAIAFYRKHGFEDVGTHLFQFGSEKHLDRVMFRSIG